MRRGGKKRGGIQFPRYGVTLQFLKSIRDDERMRTPMVKLVRPDLDVNAVSVSQLRKIASKLRVHSHLPRRAEMARYHDKSIPREDWIRALNKPPTTISQVRSCIVVPETTRLGGGAYATRILGGSDAVGIPTDVVCHAWRDSFENLVNALEEENKRRYTRIVKRVKQQRKSREQARLKRLEAEKLANGGKRPTSGGIAERLRVLERQNASLLRGERCIAANAQMTSRFAAGFGLSPVRIRVPKPNFQKPRSNHSMSRTERPSTAIGSRHRSSRNGTLPLEKRVRPGTAPAARRNVTFARDSEELKSEPMNNRSLLKTPTLSPVKTQHFNQAKSPKSFKGTASKKFVKPSNLRLKLPPGKHVNLDSMWHTIPIDDVTSPKLPFEASGTADDEAHSGSPYIMIKHGFKLTEKEIQNLPRGRLNIMLRWAQHASWAQSPFKAMAQDQKKREQSRNEDLEKKKKRKEAARSRAKQKRQHILEQSHKLALEQARQGTTHNSNARSLRRPLLTPTERITSPSSRNFAASQSQNQSHSDILALKHEREVLVYGMTHNLDYELKELEHLRRGRRTGGFGKTATDITSGVSSPRLLSPMASGEVLAKERAEADAEAKLLAEVRYYWIDLFVVNQDKTFDILNSNSTARTDDKNSQTNSNSAHRSYVENYIATTYPAGVASIKRTVLVLSEGISLRATLDLLPLTRTWCLWELYSSLSSPAGCELSIAIKPRAQSDFDSVIIENYNKLMHVVVDRVNSKDSEAFFTTKEALLKQLTIRCCKNAFADIDRAVCCGIRKWLTKEARYALENAMSMSLNVNNYKLSVQKQATHYSGESRGHSTAKNYRKSSNHVRGDGAVLDVHSVSLANQFGLMHLQDGAPEDLRLAGILFRRALKDAEKAGYPTKLLVRLRSNLAMLLKMEGKLEDALLLTKQCYEATLRISGEGTTATINAANSYASTLQALGHTEEAEALFRAALTSTQRSKNTESNHVDVNLISSATRLADLLCKSGQSNKSSPLSERIMQSSHPVMGFVDAGTLAATNTLAGMLRSQGDNTEAIRLYKRVLAASRQQLGTRHPMTFLTMYNLADSFEAEGRLQQAEKYARLSLEGYAMFNLEADVRDGTSQLGKLLRSLGRDMEADKLVERAGYSWFCGKLVKRSAKRS